MGEVVKLKPRPAELTCECGGVWFTAIVQLDAKSGKVCSLAMRVTCRDCGKECSVPMGDVL